MASFNYYSKLVIKRTPLISGSDVSPSCWSPSTVPWDLLKWLFVKHSEHFKEKVLIEIAKALHMLPCIRKISSEQTQDISGMCSRPLWLTLRQVAALWESAWGVKNVYNCDPWVFEIGKHEEAPLVWSPSPPHRTGAHHHTSACQHGCFSLWLVENSIWGKSFSTVKLWSIHILLCKADQGQGCLLFH